MEGRAERNEWMSVPQFGAWDQKTARTDYSMVFNRARAKKKQHRVEVHPIQLGKERKPQKAETLGLEHDKSHPPTKSKRKNMKNYLCCCKA